MTDAPDKPRRWGVIEPDGTFRALLDTASRGKPTLVILAPDLLIGATTSPAPAQGDAQLPAREPAAPPASGPPLPATSPENSS